MKRKKAKYRQIIWLERRCGRLMTEAREPPQHEPEPEHLHALPPATMRQSLHRDSGIDPLSSPVEPDLSWDEVTMGGLFQSHADTTLPPNARRKFRGWIVTNFNVRRVQRLIPIKSENFRLRCRNLSYKRKWNLVWC